MGKKLVYDWGGQGSVGAHGYGMLFGWDRKLCLFFKIPLNKVIIADYFYY